MPRPAVIPRELTFVPFSGSTAISRGLLTKDMLKGRTWRRLFPDIYVHADAFAPDDHRMWCDAAALMLKRGHAVGGLSAAYLWGVNLLPANAPVSVSVPRRTRMRPHPRLAVRRTTVAPGDITTFASIHVTTPLRTAFDLGRRPGRTDALVAVDALTHRRLVTLEALARYAAQRTGWPGSRQLDEVLSLAQPLTESPMETRLRMLLHDAGVPPLTAQHEVRDDRGRLIGRVDLAYPQWRIAIEYEGDHHRERSRFRRDIARLNELRAAGWLVLRFTAEDVLRHPRRVAAQVAAAISERSHPRPVATPMAAATNKRGQRTSHTGSGVSTTSPSF